MATSSHWSFEPFRLDLTNTCLWRDEVMVALRPKPFAVLAYLVTHAGETVTKDALLEAVWPETAVGDAVLKDCIRQVRRALGETAQEPQYVATVHRRGYRFIAAVTAVEPTPAIHHAPRPGPRGAELDFQAPQLVATTSATSVVAREAELARLHQWWAAARQGERRIGWIAGEAGIGKTSLVETFIAQVATPDTVWIGHGQCIEQYGAGEAYLPLLEAVGRLGRSPHGTPLVELMWQVAPSWLAQLPTLVSAHDLATLQQRGYGTTRERMLRELAELVELLSGSDPLILVLEDLHWSDTSTLEWLAYVARRRESARLLVLGTYPPVEAIVRAHPLRSVVRELQRHDQCDNLQLGGLSKSGVATYLDQRFAGLPFTDRLSDTLHQRTTGHPLFLMSLLDDMVQRGVLREVPDGWEVGDGIEEAVHRVPESLRLMIEQQLERLAPKDRRLLKAASVVGVDFTAAAVAAGLDD